MGKINHQIVFNTLKNYQTGQLLTTSFGTQAKGKWHLLNLFGRLNAAKVAANINELFNKYEFQALYANGNTQDKDSLKLAIQTLNLQLGHSHKTKEGSPLQAALDKIQRMDSQGNVNDHRKATTTPSPRNLLFSNLQRKKSPQVSSEAELTQLIAATPELNKHPRAQQELTRMQKENPSMTPQALIDHFLMTHSTKGTETQQIVIPEILVIHLGGQNYEVKKGSQVTLQLPGYLKGAKVSLNQNSITVQDIANPFNVPTFYPFKELTQFEKEFDVQVTNPLQQHINVFNSQ